MHRLTLLAGAAAAAAVTALTSVFPAAAQPEAETGPDTVACAAANADVLLKGVVVVNAAEALAGVQEGLDQAFAAVKDKLAVLQAAEARPDNDPGKAAAVAAAAAQLEVAKEAFAALVDPVRDVQLTQALTEAETKLANAIAAQKTACAEPKPEPEPDPEPAPRDLDCSDFVGADGRLDRAAAQSKLDEDKSDPHNLDVDGDGLACEDDEPPAPGGQVGQVPVGPAETGGR